jgi:hypothetical protein
VLEFNPMGTRISFTGIMPTSITGSTTIGQPIVLNDSSLPGSVFQGKGGDFLDPDYILNQVNMLSGGLAASNQYPLLSIIDPQPYGFNPKAGTILSNTQNAINNILSPGFGLGLLQQNNLPYQNLGPGLPSVPLLGQNPDPFQILAAANRPFLQDPTLALGGLGFNNFSALNGLGSNGLFGTNTLPLGSIGGFNVLG